jgi:hypothetical protein
VIDRGIAVRVDTVTKRFLRMGGAFLCGASGGNTTVVHLAREVLAAILARGRLTVLSDALRERISRPRGAIVRVSAGEDAASVQLVRLRDAAIVTLGRWAGILHLACREARARQESQPQAHCGEKQTDVHLLSPFSPSRVLKARAKDGNRRANRWSCAIGALVAESLRESIPEGEGHERTDA